MIDKTNTPNEVVDVVDENDKIIGQKTKREVNSNPKIIHREVAIIIYNNKNKILIQKRSEKKLVDPDIWAMSVAGHIPAGMKPAEAAHMELKEELGFDTNLTFLSKQLIHYDNETHFAYLYKGKYNNQKINFEEAEIQKVKFVTEKECKKLIKEGEEIEPYTYKRMKKFWKSN